MGTLGYLLDTHTLLWASSDDKQLSAKARRIIKDPDLPLYVSSVSAYEIMNKYRIGKLPGYADIAENYLESLSEFGAYELSLSTAHSHYAGEFEWDHRDPFDRMLAAQAYVDNLTLITNDPAFDTLPWVTTLW